MGMDLCSVGMCTSGASHDGVALLSSDARPHGAARVRVLVGVNTYSVSVGDLAPLS